MMLMVFTDFSPDVVVGSIQRIIHMDNRNFVCAMIGPKGSSKSWSALSMCEEVDPNFSDKTIVFSTIDLLKLMTQKPQLPAGTAILYEESSVSANNRDWYSFFNKALTAVVDTFRYRNYFLVFTTPFQGSVDIKLRRSFDAIFDMTGEINKKERYAVANYQLVKVHELYGKGQPVYPKLRINTKRGICKMVRYRIYAPSDPLIKKYEKMKNEFGDNLYENLLMEAKTEMAKKYYVQDKYMPHYEEPATDPRLWQGKDKANL